MLSYKSWKETWFLSRHHLENGTLNLLLRAYGNIRVVQLKINGYLKIQGFYESSFFWLSFRIRPSKTDLVNPHIFAIDFINRFINFMEDKEKLPEFYIHVTVHRNKFLFNKTNRRTNLPKLFLSRNSTCFGQFLCPSSGVFPCTFGTGICHTGSLQFHPDRAWKLSSKLAWHIPVPNVQGKTPDDGQRDCPKHVDFLYKNNVGKLVCLLVLLKRKIARFHALAAVFL